MRRGILRQNLLHRYLDIKKVADGVLVFNAIEPPQDRPALGALLRGRLVQQRRELLDHSRHLRGLRPGLLRRRHFPGLHARDNFPPALECCRAGEVGVQLVEPEVGLRLGWAVAADAMLFKERLRDANDAGTIWHGGRVGGYGVWGQHGDSHQHLRETTHRVSVLLLGTKGGPQRRQILWYLGTKAQQGKWSRVASNPSARSLPPGSLASAYYRYAATAPHFMAQKPD